MLVRNYGSGQPNWIPGTIHRKKKGLFVYDVKVGKLFWVRHGNQLRPKCIQNNQVDNMPTIPFDILMDTFELPSLSPPVQTNVNRREVRPYRILPKRNRTRVRYLQINPKHVHYSQMLKRGGVGDQT